MKRSFFSLSAILLIAGGMIAFLTTGCGQTHQDHFRIEAVLQHAPLQDVFLDEVQLGETKTIDTDKIQDASGRFSFTGITPEEELYRVRLGAGKVFFLAVEGGDDIKISGDYNHLDKITISGSPASADLNEFLSALNNKNNELRKMIGRYDTLKAWKVPDSVLAVKAAEIRQRTGELSDTIIDFARSSRSAAATAFTLSLLQTQEELLKAKSIFDSLTIRFPHSELVQSMVDTYNKFMNNSGATTAVTIGSMAPEISYPDPDGKLISLSSFRGKYLLVDFWASWCDPCRHENPNVVKAYNEFRDRNFTILGVSLDSRKDSWTKAIQQDGLVWSQVSDLKGWDSAPAAAYGVESIPANFLIDPQGKIIAENLRGDDLENTLAKVLK